MASFLMYSVTELVCDSQVTLREIQIMILGKVKVFSRWLKIEPTSPIHHVAVLTRLYACRCSLEESVTPTAINARIRNFKGRRDVTLYVLNIFVASL